ncbi:MAG: CRTAC1 family protein [Acidobacteriota bacterium]
MIAAAALIAAVPAFGDESPSRLGGWTFTEVAVDAGVRFEHSLPAGAPGEPLMMHGGAAAGDLDGDGRLDLVAVRGPELGVALYVNLGDGTFADRADDAGIRLAGRFVHGVAMADIDGDDDLDVLFGGVAAQRPVLMANRGDGTFEDISATAGLVSNRDTFSSAFADIDLDGDLDLFITHWSGDQIGQLPANHLWRNNGDSTVSPIDFIAGIAPIFTTLDWSFTPNFVDLDGDLDPDLLLASDFLTSQVVENLGDGTFEITTDTSVITDENGMGAAVGDFDGDGLWDWFVSSIWDPNGVNEANWGITGNRLYRGLGDGSFEDVTEAAGVREGYWGWGSCAGDFDLDGDLDLFHVNGFPALQAFEFHDDPSRLFLNRGDGTFDERSTELGVADTGQGRAVVCFDYDLDGDLDLFVGNHRGPSRLFRNDLAESRSWLSLDLRQNGANTRAVGAEVRVRADGRTVLRQVAAGNNFVSQDPAVIHVGLGDASSVDEVEIRWPDGEFEVLEGVDVNQPLRYLRGSRTPVVDIPAAGELGLVALALALALAAVLKLRR